ncbi:MAG: S49 family peptidase [Magnetococcales bacterium]|nr:S49 family peptidase [Magnetococcales bacterium]
MENIPSPSGGNETSGSSLQEVLTTLTQSLAEERQVLCDLVRESQREQRRDRNLRHAFRWFIALYLVVLLLLSNRHELSSLMDQEGSKTSHTALVVLKGEIMPEGDGSASKVMEALQDAFKHPDTKAVILQINSPGGSPVQAGRIYDEIIRLQKKHDTIPLYAVLDDICASGGYYVAAAAKEIYADKATLVGSIGVIMRGFGMEETMRKIGMESRLLTAGENKAFLDPFEPVKEKEKLHAKSILNEIHAQFVQSVKTGRGERLKGSDEALFNGLIWTGEEALRLGLVDGLGSVEWVAREVVKVEDVVDFTIKPEWWETLSKGMTSTVFGWLRGQIRQPGWF